MVFKRKIYDKLTEWKKRPNGSKAILIEGARRIGKSTIAEEFAKNNYRSYVLIDFSKASLSIKEGFNLYNRDSLLIFDEVQSFPRAHEAIKHLVKDGRYDYIEAGSLISIRENTKEYATTSLENFNEKFKNRIKLLILFILRIYSLEKMVLFVFLLI